MMFDLSDKLTMGQNIGQGLKVSISLIDDIILAGIMCPCFQETSNTLAARHKKNQPNIHHHFTICNARHSQKISEFYPLEQYDNGSRKTPWPSVDTSRIISLRTYRIGYVLGHGFAGAAENWIRLCGTDIDIGLRFSDLSLRSCAFLPLLGSKGVESVKMPCPTFASGTQLQGRWRACQRSGPH